MSNVKVMNENYVDSDYYTGMTYSSQTTACPASNVLNFVRRTKVWRTAGYWLITSANKGIVLQEVDGVNQTVNIAEGAYTSDTTFFAAVKTALDSASGSATYTVTRDTTTNKIKITSNGGGGAIFKLMCTNASFTAAAILGYSTSTDKTGALTYTAETLKLHTSEWMRWDMGTSVNPKAFVLIGLRNTPIKISETATIKLQGNHTDTWSSPVYDQTLTWNGNAIHQFSTTGLHTEALRYWRLEITDTANTNGYVEISNIYLGDMLVFTQGAVQFPLRITKADLGSVTYGRSGTRFSDEIQFTDEIDMDWAGLSNSEAEQLADMIGIVGKTKPFFVALDADESFSTYGETQTRYVAFTSDPVLTFVSPNFWSSSWQVREEV